MIREIIIIPVQAMLAQAGAFVSAFCAVILVLVVGWIIAKIIKNLVIRILDILQIDSTAERVGVDKILAKGGIKYSITELVAVLSYWLVMLISLIIAIGLVNVGEQAASILNAIVLYIPNVISVIFILMLGMFFASFVNSIVQTAAANAGIEQSALFGKISQLVIVVFAIAISLEQLHIGSQVIGFAINILLASFGLAFALAFGLGCKDLAGKITHEFLEKIKSKK